MAMHRDFADWYRSASITPPSELLEQRWQGVEALAGDLNTEELVELLTMFCVRNVPINVPDYFDQAFRGPDPSFPTRDHGEEIRVLAGAVLRQTIEGGEPTAVAASLGLSAGSYGPRRTGTSFREHAEAAEKYIATKGEVTREVKNPAPQQGLNWTKERFEELIPAAHFAANTIQNLKDPLLATFNEQGKQFATKLTTATNALWRALNIQREELNLLWWLQTKLSRDLNEPFSTLTRQVASIVLPLEVSDLTSLLPGPIASRGIIITALTEASGDDASLNIASAINAVPRVWRERRHAESQNVNTGSLCPVHLAMAKSLETDGESDWFPVYKKNCEIDLSANVSARELALQVYTERLFIRALGEMQNE